MRVAREAVVADEDVAIAQVRVHQRRPADVGGVERRGGRVGQQTRRCVEHHQEVRGGEPAAALLPTRRAEHANQLRRVGHREARTVDVERAVPVPEVIGVVRPGHRRGGDTTHQRPVHLQRKPRAGLTPRRGREARSRQMTHRGAGRVAGDHLLDEQRHRHRRVQLTLTPRVAQLPANLLHNARIQNAQRITLDPPQRRGDTGHPWPPVLMLLRNTIISGGLVSRKSP